MSGGDVTRRRILSLSVQAAVGLGFGGAALSGCSPPSKPRQTVDTHGGGNISALISVGGSLIAGDDQGAVFIWDLNTWKLTKNDARTAEKLSPVSSISPLDADSILVSQGSLNVYDVKTAKLARTIYEQPISGSQLADKLVSSCSAVLPEGRIADATGGGTVRIWAHSGGQVAELTDGVDRGYVSSLAVNKAGTKLAAGFFDIAHAGAPGTPVPKSVLVWDVQTQKVAGEYKTSEPTVLFGSGDSLMYFTADGFTLDPAPAGFRRHKTDSDVCAYNATRNIAALGTRTDISVIDCATGKELKKITGSDSRHFGALTILDDGRTLVSGLEDGLIKLWDI